MFGKGATRYLVLLLVALAALWVLSSLFGTRSKSRTFRSEVIRLDTNAVSAIAIRSPKAGPDGLLIERRAAAWVMTAEGREYSVDERIISKVFTDLALVKTDHVIGPVGKHRDAKGLSDSAATRLDFTTGSGTVSIIVGKESYNTQGQPQTAVMVPGDDMVYGLPTLFMSIRELTLDGLRPHTLVKGDPHDWQRLTFTFPQDSGYVLERTGERWLVDSMPTDSIKVTRFLQSLAFSRAQSFADTVKIDGLTPGFQLKVEHLSGKEPIAVNVYPYGYTWVVTSTANPGNVMYFDPQRELPRMFRPRHTWFPEPAREAGH